MCYQFIYIFTSLIVYQSKVFGDIYACHELLLGYGKIILLYQSDIFMDSQHLANKYHEFPAPDRDWSIEHMVH